MANGPALAERSAADALPVLVESYGDRLYALARRVCASDADAHDLVQETFLRAFEKWDQFEGRADPGTWLHTILVRLCSKRFRKQATRDAKGAMLPFGDKVLDLPSHGASPLDDQIRAEAKDVIDNAIADLPVAMRIPLVLREIAELPYSDVAAILGLKEPTVRTRVHRGRIMLREALLEGLPAKEAPPATASRKLCMDLLAAKQAALDKGVPFPVADDLCERCRLVFRDLDVTDSACQALKGDHLPDSLKRDVLGVMADGASA